MFTDVEASTGTTTRMGDEAAGRLFGEHDRIVREQVAAHGGRTVRSTGDGFVVLFDSARKAVGCALSIQRDLAAQQDGIRVRIGLNAGEVVEGDGELFGAAVNLAARVMERAGGGEILVTETVRQVAGTMPAARFRDRGRVALKGFPERQRLHEVRQADGHTRPPRRSRRLMLVAGALVVGAATLALGLATRDGEKTVEVLENSVAILDPDDGRVVTDVPVGIRPGGLAVTAGSVWVANLGDNTVTEISARSRRVRGTVSAGIAVDGLGAGPSGVWVADSDRSLARVLDPDFRTVARSVPLDPAKGDPQEARPMAVTAEAVWIAGSGREIRRLDPDSSRTVAKIPSGNGPSGVAVGAGSVWVSDSTDGTVTRIDPRTNQIAATVPVGEGASGIAVGTGGVWVTVPLEDRVKRVDPASNAVTDTVRVGGAPGALAIGAGAVWVTSRRGGTVARIDPATARVTRTVRVGHSPQGVAVADGAVWVAVQANAARPARTPRDRPDVLTVLRPQGLPTGTDPALAFAGQPQTHATCALLFDYPDRPFPAGAQLRPEVAEAMPEVSDGGRTYTFRLRPGFRFSPPSNAPVTAHAFRRAIERALHPRTESYAAVIMSDIAGARAYSAGRATRLAGVTSRGDTLTIRLTAPSRTLLPRLASTYFCAVPPTTPISAAGIGQIPMAGPYYIASYVPKRRLVLRRNPNYGGTRNARSREIDIDLDVAPQRSVADVEAGRADYVSTVPADRIPALARHYGPQSVAARAGRQRYFSAAAPVLHYFALNTRRPLFASRRMRLAVNVALDRQALAHRVQSGPLGGPGRPTDQFIPPGQPGFHDAAIYPVGGPDLQRARRLAGTRRRRAVLLTCNLPHCLEHGRVVRTSLAAIGIDVDVKNFSLGQMFKRLARPGEPWDIGYNNWFLDYADPSQFIAPMFAAPPDGGNPGRFHDEGIFRRMRTAARLSGTARSRAFAQIDADLARAGAAAPFATAVTTDFFSDRIGCQVHQPIYGIALEELCVRDK
jgi:peptide/nickel transport system substrate-binding protein